MAEPGSGRASGVQVVERIAEMLRALEAEPDGLSLAEIASRVKLARSTVGRLVLALAREGFVSPVGPQGRFRLGPELARLGAASRRDLREELGGFMQQLAKQIEETVDLTVLDGDHVRVVEHIPSQHLLRAVSETGSALPLHPTAPGKAFLATMPREEAERLLPRVLPAFTAHTITSRTALWRELDEIARTGLAVAREEYTMGVCAIAAVVRDANGPVGAIVIVTPQLRFADTEHELGQRLLEVAAEASLALGAPPAA